MWMGIGDGDVDVEGGKGIPKGIKGSSFMRRVNFCQRFSS